VPPFHYATNVIVSMLRGRCPRGKRLISHRSARNAGRRKSHDPELFHVGEISAPASGRETCHRRSRATPRTLRPVPTIARCGTPFVTVMLQIAGQNSDQRPAAALPHAKALACFNEHLVTNTARWCSRTLARWGLRASCRSAETRLIAAAVRRPGSRA